MSEKFYQKHSEWLIPVLCIIVIFQAVMLFSDEARQQVSLVTQGLPLINEQVVPTLVPQQLAVAEVQFIPESVKAVKNKPIKVGVWLKPVTAINLGGMDLVIRFDPKMAVITKVETQKVFSLVIPNRTSEVNGRLFVTYLDEDGKGVVVNKAVKLLDVTLTPKLAGELVLGIVSSTQGATTVMAEKTTSASLPFTAGNLTIVVGEK